jgi:adenosylcobyric acid synthase
MNSNILMIQGTSSGAGKSLMVTALCRILSDKGYRVAPFKSQNMSSLIFHINGTNKIMAQAQAVQALGARTAPDVRMNPILLKPIGNYESEVYVYGEFLSTMRAQEYYTSFVLKKGFKLALDAFKSLRKENDLIILEGAGSPAEINIQKYDIANMLLAEKVNAPVLLVADIERGGCFASILGTILLLKPKYRDLIKGLIINKFLGDKHILLPAVKRIESDTKKPVLGIVPKIDHIIPSEDSLDGGVGHTKSNNNSNNNNHQDKNNIKCVEGSEIIDKEISKVSKIIKSTINVEYILRNLLK